MLATASGRRNLTPMNATQIAEYVRKHGKTTQIIEETGDAENGPNCSVSPEFKRLGPFQLFEENGGVWLHCDRKDHPEGGLTLIDTIPTAQF
jgi:hypothetical protein